MMWFIINFIIIISLAIQFVMLIAPRDFKFDELFNPITIYKEHKVNYFGAFLLTLFSNCFLFIYAICFWFYKLCTVGRKK